MITNGISYSDGDVVKTDVCIIGSGPAGITAAWHLQAAWAGRKKITLIEGSRQVDLQTSRQDKKLLYGGAAEGLFQRNHESDFLTRPNYEGESPSERERIYGGTSLHWGGQCRPLDPVTFKKRPGFPGWPISRDDLDPYYKKAGTFLSLHGDFSADDWEKVFTADYWANELGAEAPKLTAFDAEMYQFRYVNFAKQRFDGEHQIGDLVDVILNASLLDIDHIGGHVTRLHVASMKMEDGKLKKATKFAIEANAYVLACGTVANARQLLLSNVGNDCVGRYFMCHPIADGVVTIPGLPNEAQTRLMRGNKQDGDQWKENGVTVGGRFTPDAIEQEKLEIGGSWFDINWNGLYFEMTPNPDSRITLADTCDEVFGQKQTKITWELSARDETTYKYSLQMFQNALSGVTFEAWNDVKDSWVVNGHHIGTTRMSNGPEDGVVDKNLKVHSLDNLYVAGASVFPSAGVSNPTFTIVTLSIRLADHLIKVI